MVYIVNININSKKKLLSALSQLFGIGKHQCFQICNELGLNIQKHLGQLTQNELEQLTQLLTQNYELGIDVKRVIKKNIHRLIRIGAYRGFRHSQGLPVRGQRTHGNSRTAKKLRQG